MAVLRFSVRAGSDLTDIANYTLRMWGEDQTLRYLDELDACCQRLGEHPGLGRACDDVRPGLRRMEYGSHVIFYRQVAGAVLVSRILHQRMVPGTQVI